MPTELLSSDPGKTLPVRFSYQPLIGGRQQVFVAGDFNDWSPTANPLEENHGIYETVISLKKGRYAYKFVVDGRWLTDDGATEFEGDRHGDQNAVVTVGNHAELNALREVEVLYLPTTPFNTLSIAGSFNQWNPHTDLLTPLGNGYWSIRLILRMGEYPYKLVVDGRDWIRNDSCEACITDDLGLENSLLVVDERDPMVSTVRGDGRMLTFGIPNRLSLEMLNPISPTRLLLRTRAYRGDVERVSLWKQGKLLPMELELEDEVFEYYHRIVELESPDEEFDFCFVYEDGNERYYLVHGEIAPTLNPAQCFHYRPGVVAVFEVPEWVQRGVFYQIYPDRFRNGDSSLNPNFYEYYYDGMNTRPPEGEKLPWGKSYYHLVEDWREIAGLKSNPLHPEGAPDWWAFYGGDIPGIREKLDYLGDLGVTILYLNPVFQARSPHRYDAVDYMRVDPHLGGNEAFQELVKDCHARGMRIILDVAFNHTGNAFWAFRDVARRGPDSPYWRWYEWKQWPLPPCNTPGFNASDYYQCWWGMGDLPELDYDLSRPGFQENGVKSSADAEANTPVVDYILKVAEFWIQDMDIDGFRLDVPNEVPFWFWERFRQRVKTLKPDAYLVGEIWSNAQEWVNPKYFDAVMNYAYFKDPVMRFFVMQKCSAAVFDHDLRPGLLSYPYQARYAMMNLLDSHDTFRFLEIAGRDVRKLKLAVMFQMTYVGAPHIYYGDEVGMAGGHDPDNRRPFDWDYIDDPVKYDLLAYYRRLIALRKAHEALMTGDFRPLYTSGRVYAYERYRNGERIWIVLNNENTAHTIALALPQGTVRAIDLLAGTEYEPTDGALQIELPELAGKILRIIH